MKIGNKVSTPDGTQGYIQSIENDQLYVSCLTNGHQSRRQRFSEEQITLYDNQKPTTGDHTPFGKVIETKLIHGDIDGMIEVTCAEPNQTNTVLWVEDKFHEMYNAHLKSNSRSFILKSNSENLQPLHNVNWISSNHIKNFSAYYGIEKTHNGEYSLAPISHEEHATKKTLSVAYKDSTDENEILDVRMNDNGDISSVYDGRNNRSFSSVFDLRMANIVEATIISEHKLTDF